MLWSAAIRISHDVGENRIGMKDTSASYCSLMMLLFDHRAKKAFTQADERQLVERIRGLWSTMSREERIEVNAVFEPVNSQYEVTMGVAWIRCPACRRPFTGDIESPPDGTPQLTLAPRCPACSSVLEIKPHIPEE